MRKTLFLNLLILLITVPYSVIYAGEQYQVNTSTSLNIRSGPGTSYKVIGTLQKNSIVEVTDFENDWAVIIYKGSKGYVNKNYLNLASVSTQVADNYSDYSDSLNGHKTITYLIIFIIAISWLVKRFSPHSNTFQFISLITVSLLELLYFTILNGETWFCNPDEVGWIMTIINFFIYIAIIIYQINLFLHLFENMRDYMHDGNLGIAIYSFLGAVVLAVLFHFSEISILFVLAALSLLLIVQAVINYNYFSTIWKSYAILFSITTIIAPLAILIIFYKFIPLLIIGGIVILVLNILGDSSKSSSSSSGKYEIECPHKGSYSAVCKLSEKSCPLEYNPSASCPEGITVRRE